MRMTFSTLVTPTRDSDTVNVGSWFWTSSSGSVMGSYKARDRTQAGRMDQGFTKDKRRDTCYKPGIRGAIRVPRDLRPEDRHGSKPTRRASQPPIDGTN